jgi:hypothetical protein
MNFQYLSFMTTALDLELAATRLHAQAAVVAVALDAVVAHHRRDVWTGGRAVRFGLDLADRRRLLQAAAEELRVEARLLHARADLLRAVTPPTP